MEIFRKKEKIIFKYSNYSFIINKRVFKLMFYIIISNSINTFFNK